ncbi:MAG TPA: ATPase, T2SS/T4P/T4SS family, partial [Candidatus Bathyarchaeia archaeon]|nr:ATPase, T2SS/T4P/T4SS family [Candidatus Bathyarchaeia archaeon]
LTGHLVFSSLHTTTAAGSVVRMMNMGIEPFLLCSSVIAVSGQRLVRRVCPKCREAYKVPPDVAKRVGLSVLTKGKDVPLFRGKGCEKCLGSGYAGRIVICELMILTTKVKEEILKGGNELNIKRVGREEGMVTMREDALVKAINGHTSLEEVLRVTASDEE